MIISKYPEQQFQQNKHIQEETEKKDEINSGESFIDIYKNTLAKAREQQNVNQYAAAVKIEPVATVPYISTQDIFLSRERNRKR